MSDEKYEAKYSHALCSQSVYIKWEQNAEVSKSAEGKVTNFSEFQIHIRFIVIKMAK